MSSNYVYLIQEREFIKTNEKIYKLGKSKQEHNKRANQYPKQSVLLFQIICTNCDKLEREMLNVFKLKYIHRKDIGNEYFEGDYEDMIKNIFFIRNNIFETCEQQKIEKLEEQQLKSLLDNKKEVKIKKTQNTKEFKQKQIQEAKEAKINQKEQKIKQIQEAKEAKQKQKEEKIKKIEEEQIKKREERKKDNIKLFLNWLEYSFKTNSLTDGPPRKSYLSFCEFMKEKDDVPMNETSFGAIMNNRDNSIPFKIGYKKKSGNFKMIFHLTNIKNWIESNTK